MKAEEILTGTKDHIIEVDQEITTEEMADETIIDKMIGMIIIDKKTEETVTEPTIDKTMEEIIIGIRNIELEVRVEMIIEKL